MKKLIFVLSLLLIMGNLLACSGPVIQIEITEAEPQEIIEDPQEEINDNQEIQEPIKEEIQEPQDNINSPILVYDDELFTLEFIRFDVDYSPCLVFNVTNKSQQDIGFYIDAIAVNGVTETPALMVDVLAGTTNEYWCDVSTTEGMEILTGTICIVDGEGYTIKECSINNVPLS